MVEYTCMDLYKTSRQLQGVYFTFEGVSMQISLYIKFYKRTATEFFMSATALLNSEKCSSGE